MPAEVELTSVPALTSLYGKALLTGLAGKRRTGPDAESGTLPDTAYRRPAVPIDPEHLAAYTAVCGFRLADELPITYPHLLGFPLQIKLLTDREFPFPLIGSVHLANRITQVQPLRVTDRPDVRVHVANLRAHPKGRQFDLITEVSLGGVVVWHSVSTYLRRGAESGGSERERTADREPPPEPTAVWRVPGDIGRRYGAVSGDRNPIHLHPLTARLLGFRKAIAHGMWTKARCLAAFEGRLPEACTVDVRFKLPVLLPAKVGFTARTGGFDLFDARTGKPHLAGTIETD